MFKSKLKKNSDLTQGPIFSTLLLFALPTLISNILQSLNGSINSIWLGRFLGAQALAATLNASIIMFLLFSFTFGFGLAATVNIGRSFGRRDIESARQVFGASLGICLILGIVFAIIGSVFSHEILHLLNTPAAIFEQSACYLRVIMLAMPAILILVVFMMGLRGAGDSMTPLWFMILNVFLDAGLNPLLIKGMGPFPKLGIAGSAWATVIASYSAVFSLWLYMRWKDLPLRLKGKELGYLLPRPPYLISLLFQGFFMSLQMIVLSTAGLVIIGLLNHESTSLIAAYNVNQQLWSYLQMPAMAVSAGVSAMAAQNIGAGQWERVQAVLRMGMLIALGMTAILLAVLIIFDEPVMRIFFANDATVLKEACHIQLLGSWSYIFFGLSLVMGGAMRANGAVVVPLIALFVSIYPIRFGAYHLLYPMLQSDALWLSFPISSFAGFVMLYIYYKLPYWRKPKVS